MARKNAKEAATPARRAKRAPKTAARPRSRAVAEGSAGNGEAPAAGRAPAAPRRGRSLVVVESPAKARTINRYLGSAYEVKASMGHVRDLPVKELGVDVDNAFEPRYVTIRGKGNVIKELRASARRAAAIYLACDLDREGEAIAWSLADMLGEDGKPMKRVIMNEITERAIKEAFANPLEIDQNKVDAQQARRILDRLVGYKVSPLLWKVIHRRTSAGRVQSVALRLIVEREVEIRKFTPREYWTVELELVTPAGETFRARLVKRGGEKIEIGSEAEAQEVREAIERAAAFRIVELTRKERQRSPKPPFITSTLQQDASQRLGMSPRRTMQVAQELYEGLDIGRGEVVGLITYMRTDSVRLATEAVEETRAFIAEQWGQEYLPAKPPVYKKARGGPVQDAHEAIRPTDVRHRPAEVQGLTEDQRRLYDLIWRRHVAGQMKPAVDLVTTLDVEAGEFLFRATGRVPVFAGYRAVYEEVDGNEPEDAALPQLDEGMALGRGAIEAKQHFTEPPPRYSEATLIRELEANGVGRPSTYATIVSTITERKYAEREKGRLQPSPLGETVFRILNDHFSDIFSVDFTARMEAELDRIEAGEYRWQDVVGEFYGPLKHDLEQVMSRTADLKAALTDATDIECPDCGKPLVVKWGRNGRFLACSGFPDCRHSRPLPEDAPPEVAAVACDKCGSPMIVRSGRFGRFLACQSYPQCKHTRPLPVGVSCPEEGCKGDLTERRTRKGRLFYGCSRYPDCKFATWDRPVAGPCPACGSPCLVEKTRQSQSVVSCPRCSHRVEHAAAVAGRE